MRAAALVLGAALAMPAPSFAHCYTIWHNPWPQHCGGVYARSKDRSWYVELVTPPPLPPEKDERSPQDIADQAEHDRAVAAHHDEINFLMSVLHNQEQTTGQ